MIEGKILIHLVSKEGVRINLERVSMIDKIPRPKNVKGIQSFFGQVNLKKIFVTNFAKKTRPISKMLKKGANIRWDGDPLVAFQNIKEEI